MEAYKWTSNIWTGNYYCHVDDDITLWRMAGNAPHMYWATAFAMPDSPRTGAYKAPKAAIKALRKMIQKGNASREVSDATV